MVTPETLLAAARAESIPAGESGLWLVHKSHLETQAYGYRGDRLTSLDPGIYTHLFRMSLLAMHRNPPGECVMEDTPHELRTHLDFMLKARGRVLVTGLGLGCVVRGLLANPAVEHVTCIEKSADVLALVQPYMPKERLTIIQADAFEWTENNEEQFDYGWHDLWTNRDVGEPHLDVWHMRLLFNCAETVGVQGAWEFGRDFRRVLKEKGIRLL